jgi:hypothetical protein
MQKIDIYRILWMEYRLIRHFGQQGGTPMPLVRISIPAHLPPKGARLSMRAWALVSTCNIPANELFSSYRGFRPRIC